MHTKTWHAVSFSKVAVCLVMNYNCIDARISITWACLQIYSRFKRISEHCTDLRDSPSAWCIHLIPSIESTRLSRNPLEVNNIQQINSKKNITQHNITFSIHSNTFTYILWYEFLITNKYFNVIKSVPKNESLKWIVFIFYTPFMRILFIRMTSSILSNF